MSFQSFENSSMASQVAAVPWERLPELFDLSISWQVLDGQDRGVSKATEKSVERVNWLYGLKLPISYQEFVGRSREANKWLTGVGEDYEAERHLVRMNRLWRNLPRKSRIPSHLVMFNLGFDEDCDCFDLNLYDAQTGEYAIRYWYPGFGEDVLYPSFEAYIRAQTAAWCELKVQGREIELVFLIKKLLAEYAPVS
ncbi:hypothetical protein SAMN02745857_03162 [Andreprevotia lacus DSM 23236]|jgi:hypothetical protein|uniref:SMI1 / KNR4 family (SUKH-1) n=1 Tax=Andreprevotia lacus DSM 23236 TaxID=1121001 RepID=A0A1W1XWG7_9NEIS|nr:SMI1/KNR4 family protein [Andreprevotia lacus]SMC28217.1 hypothetical protein SAMN02745857_03162 [Andreprevotia lacus DSM 23236]